ncbi:MAG: TM2 domain-containing protein [Pseudomonadota bacterium]|nr:TM2 domain-containing protein [Pseudomonadota bacterium]
METQGTKQNQKNRLLALVLGMVLGLFGADRFYLGKWKSGVAKALTFGGLGIWWFIDGAMLLIDAFLHSLGRDVGFVKDANGQDLRYGLSMYRIKDGGLQRDWFVD